MSRITDIYFLFVFFSVHIFWTQLKGSTVGAFNLTSVSYDEMRSSSKYHSYSNSKIIHFAQVWIDKPRNQILVGARDYLLRLSLRDLQPLEVVPWVPENRTVDICQHKGQKAEDCHNFVRVLLIHDSRVFTCGTNAFYPRCSWRRVDHLTHEEDQLDGQAMCPYSPHHNSTFLMTSNGDYYSATTMDFTGSDPAIYRIMGPSPRLRTAQYNSKWLNEPDFVSAFEIGDFVYFFFRETASEFANCGKAVYSRVARMCKNDVGGDFLLRDTWTTFLKARLNCSIQGTVPFYYNYLQDVYYMPEASTFYATFTTGPNDVAGSAVCSYSLTNVDIAFKGSFTYQENLKSTWQAVQNPNAGISQCAGGGAATRNRRHADSRTRRQSESQAGPQETPSRFSKLVDAQRYQLMQLPVTPLDPSPMMKSDQTRWTHIVAHRPFGKNDRQFSVVFVATLEGRLQKLVSLDSSSSSPSQHCLVEDIALFPSIEELKRSGGQKSIGIEGLGIGNGRGGGRVLTLKLDAEENAVIVGTETAVIKVPFERCHRHETRTLCVAAQDPYCGWDSVTSSCTARPSANRLHWWHQDVKSCPSNKAPLDGRYGNWTAWYTCPNQDGDTCLCRLRACDNPAPANGGRTCQGHSVQVANCTVNGGWTSWSDWGACSATCGLAVRMRKRTCSNPSPAFGGRHCGGKDVEEEVCDDIPATCVSEPPSVVTSHWAPWGSWDECSRNCGGGYQKRDRRCSRDGRSTQCPGSEVNYRECNIGPCEEVRKSSSWTSWIRTLNVTSGGGFVEQRYRISCRAQVPYPSMLKVGPTKRQVRVCTGSAAGGGVTCSTPTNGALSDLEGEKGVSTGRSWPPPAQGLNYDDEIEFQPRADMDKISAWTPWSMWTACSVSCGGGVRVRYRSCKGTICQGSSNDIASCNRGRCPDSDGWSEWSAWSACGTDDQQHRYRRCLVSHPTHSQCKGGYAEARLCSDEAVPDPSHVSSHPASDNGGFSTLHLVMAALAGFALGGATCVGVLLACQTQIKRHQTRGGGSGGGNLHHNNNSKASNLYVATPLPYAPSTPTIHKNSFHASVNNANANVAATSGGVGQYVSATTANHLVGNNLSNHHQHHIYNAPSNLTSNHNNNNNINNNINHGGGGGGRGLERSASTAASAAAARDIYAATSPINSNTTLARNFSTLPSRNGSEKSSSRSGNCATINRNGTLNRNGSINKAREWGSTLNKEKNSAIQKRNSIMQQLNADNMRTNLDYDDL